MTQETTNDTDPSIEERIEALEDEIKTLRRGEVDIDTPTPDEGES